MRFGTWDTLFNILLLIFWFRVWTGDDRNLYFNPYLAPLGRLSDSILNFLRPVFFGMPPRLIAGIALASLLLFRGMLVPPRAQWLLTLGFEGSRLNASSIASRIAFSLLSFAIFLFKLWGFSVIYAWTRRGSSSRHTVDTIYHLSRPFADLRTEFRPLWLLAYGIILVFLTGLVGTRVSIIRIPGMTSLQNGAPVALFIRLTVSALAEWVHILMTIRFVMIVLIIGSLVSTFTASHSLMFFCREWIDLLLGPLRRYPVRLGMFDLTPLIFICAIQLRVGGYFIGIHPILINILLRSYLNLL